MTIAPYLREIGRGKDGARSLKREQAADLMARLLDGQVSDIEAGAFAIAMRIKGETPEELAGFMDAVAPRLLPLPVPPASGAVVLPSYNGARKLPNLVPLLALQLAREGLPVLVHGLEEDPGRVTTAAVFEALGLPAVRDAAGVAARWAAGAPAFIATDDLHPALARVLALRRVIGLRNPAHSLAKLLPALGPQRNVARVVNHTHPEYATSLGQFLALTRATALLMRGTEGEPVADARRCPKLTAFLDGVEQPALSVAAQGGSLTSVPALPTAIDASTTARYIDEVMAGAEPLPTPIATQMMALRALAGAGRT
jgi:anthranilate phosphoribosyltransferase